MTKASNSQWLLGLIFLVSTSSSYGQFPNETTNSYHQKDLPAVEYAASITTEDLRNYLQILASDALEGRETGSRGQKMAATFIEQHFIDNKLSPVVPKVSGKSYKQTFSVVRSYYEKIYLANEQGKFNHMEDLLFYGDIAINEEQSMDLRFVGLGESDDYKGIDVKDKMVTFFATSRDDRTRKVKIAKDLGAQGFLIINSDSEASFHKYLEEYGHYFVQDAIGEKPTASGEDLMFFGPPEVVANLLSTTVDQLRSVMNPQSKKKALRMIKTASVKVLAEKINNELTTENVLGYIEGSDKKEEVIVLTAHYDHEGISGEHIFNGADDDGSGTVAILEIAQAFSLAKQAGHRPRRSLLFMTVTGEEKGLLGSSYYVEHPIFPLVNTVANLNIDMIGRVDESHELEDKYVYVIGADRLSQDLHDINEKVNTLYTRLNLDYKFNAESDPNKFYYRSDHYNFAKHNIPIIFYFNGTHADYHQPSDTVDKIRFDLLKTRTELVFFTAWDLANREERIRLK